MHLTQLLALGGVILVAAMSPGPDMFIVLRNAVSSGRRAGMACAAGVALGVLCWAIVTSLGVAGLLAASAVAFTIVKLAGAAYLVLLGVRALITARRGGYPDVPEPDSTKARRGGLAAFRQGLLTNLLNPKVAVFFIALLPQFVPHSATVFDTAALGAVAATVTLVWFSVLAGVVDVFRRFLAAAKVRRAMDAVMGTILVGIGVKIAVQQ